MRCTVRRPRAQAQAQARQEAQGAGARIMSSAEQDQAIVRIDMRGGSLCAAASDAGEITIALETPNTLPRSAIVRLLLRIDRETAAQIHRELSSALARPLALEKTP